MRKIQQKWNAQDYAKNSSAQQQWATELIAKLRLRGDESVLDVGCGDGKITAQLALTAKEGYLLGIDLSEDMVELATKRYPSTEYPNLSFLQMDATQLQLSKKFDVAFSSAALHWVKDHAAVLQGIHASLKPGGKVLLQMGGYGNASGVLTAIKEVAQDARWKQYLEGFAPPYYFYGPQEYTTWLENSGFRPERVVLIPKDMQHQGANGLIGWLRTTWFPYTDRLPINLRESFLAQLQETYTATHPLDSSGNTHVAMIRLEVEAYAL